MKKVLYLISEILIIFLFLFGTINYGYYTFSNISLLFKSQEFEAKILNVEIVKKRRDHHCTIVFEYAEENKNYINEAKFSWNILKGITNSIKPDYAEGKSITICKNQFEFFQVKDQIKSEIFINLLFFIICLSISTFLIEFLYSSFPEKHKKSFYIQGKNFKIKRIKNLESVSFYINQLKQNEILCFGIENKNGFVEYSFHNNNFIERKSNKEREETEKIIDEHSLETSVKRRIKLLENKA